MSMSLFRKPFRKCYETLELGNFRIGQKCKIICNRNPNPGNLWESPGDLVKHTDPRARSQAADTELRCVAEGEHTKNSHLNVTFFLPDKQTALELTGLGQKSLCALPTQLFKLSSGHSTVGAHGWWWQGMEEIEVKLRGISGKGWRHTHIQKPCFQLLHILGDYWKLLLRKRFYC